MPERPWGEAQFEAEASMNLIEEAHRENYRTRLKLLPLSIRQAWRDQDARGMAIGSNDDLAFLGLVQPILEEVPPHTTFQLEMCRALVADLVSNFEQT